MSQEREVEDVLLPMLSLETKQEREIEDVITRIIAPMLAINQPTVDLIEHKDVGDGIGRLEVFHVFVNNTNTVKRLSNLQMGAYIAAQISGIEGLRVMVIMSGRRASLQMINYIYCRSPGYRIVKHNSEQLVLAPRLFMLNDKRNRDSPRCSRVLVVPPNIQFGLRGQSADIIIYNCPLHGDGDSCHFSNVIQRLSESDSE